MGINFRTESFRDDFTFKNSLDHIRRFPFPFHEDSYMYAVNIEPHVVGPKGSVLENLIDVDEHYVSEMADRALVLAEDPLRCQSLPHMSRSGPKQSTATSTAGRTGRCAAVISTATTAAEPSGASPSRTAGQAASDARASTSRV